MTSETHTPAAANPFPMPEFDTVRRGGYNPDQVDTFCRDIHQIGEEARAELEERRAEIATLRAEIETLKAQVSTLEEAEAAIGRALVLAENQAEDIVSAAQTRAASIIDEAKAVAATMVADAEAAAAALKAEGASLRADAIFEAERLLAACEDTRLSVAALVGTLTPELETVEDQLAAAVNATSSDEEE